MNVQSLIAMRRLTKNISDSDLEQLGYYNSKDVWQKRLRHLIVTGLLVCLWYSTAVITITTSKEVMNRVQFPFLLCSVQFIFAGGLSWLYLNYSGTLKSASSQIVNYIYQISLSYTLGFILTNWAFSIGGLFIFYRLFI